MTKKKVILAVDADEAGQALRQEFIRRLGAEVCYLVDFDDCKDANDYLVKYGAEKLRHVIDNVRPVPLEGVSTLRDIEDELKDFVKNGSNQAFKLALITLTKYSVHTLVSLLLLLACLVLVSLTLLIKWLWVTISYTVGKQLMHLLKINLFIYTRIS